MLLLVASQLANLNVDRFVRELENSYDSLSLESLEKTAEHAKSVLSYIRGRGGGYNLRGEPVGKKANAQRPSHVEPELWDPLTPGQKKDKLGLVKILQSRLEKLIAQLADRAITMRGLLAINLFKGSENSIVIPDLKSLNLESLKPSEFSFAGNLVAASSSGKQAAEPCEFEGAEFEAEKHSSISDKFVSALVSIEANKARLAAAHRVKYCDRPKAANESDTMFEHVEQFPRKTDL